jgi:hypothetical protein
MYNQPPKKAIPKYMIYVHDRSLVEVVSRGSFPDTVRIKKQGREIECYEYELEVPPEGYETSSEKTG